MVRFALPLLLALLTLAVAPAGFARADGGAAPCDPLARRVVAAGGDGPVFLSSWEGAADPALAGAAFTYDNALAAIALTACDRPAEARRIAAALALAATADRAGPEGRLRNAYRAGPQAAPTPPHGWWDAAAGRWLEDDYQVGTATGNVAWAALALLTVAEATPDAPEAAALAQAAERLARWIVTATTDDRGAGGFRGGIHGGEAAPRPLTWKSTEHAADAAALFAWLDRRDGTGDRWAAPAAAARRFLDAQWRTEAGRFATGTLPDGVTRNDGVSGLDAQLWPLLLAYAPADWRRALDHVTADFASAGGVSFAAGRPGFWTEGTAQAALVFALAGRTDAAAGFLTEALAQASPAGLLWATKGARLATGLAIGPDSTTDDFFYYRLPHLGATAWAVLAAERWNPFTGRRIPD